MVLPSAGIIGRPYRIASITRSSLAGAPLSRYSFLKIPRSDCPFSGSLVRSLWHCAQCSHHWPTTTADCQNCHKTSSPYPRFHEVANILPLLEGPAFGELVTDIRAHGLREPITVLRDGRLLDGRNRLRGCLMAGVQPRTTAS